MEILRQPVNHSSAWTGEEMRGTRSWTIQWPAAVVAEVESAAEGLRASGTAAPAFRRKDPDTNWKLYAEHPRVLMPGGKGDYTDWETNDTPEISRRNLARVVRLLEMPAAAAHRERLLAGVSAGLQQGTAPGQVPERLLAMIGKRSASPPAADEAGRAAFVTTCAPCHQTDGSGMERLGAPLRNSPWVLGQEDGLIRIVLHGLKGDLLMPPMGTLDDRQLAGVLTYIRGAWGHQAGPISPEAVGRVRAASKGRCPRASTRSR